MVVRFLLICALLSVSLFAKESGRYAFRAQKYLEEGKFASAYSLYEAALLASRKESDLLSESRILLSMAQIRTSSLDLELADSLLSQVREDVLDLNTKLALLQAKISLDNIKGKHSEVLSKVASVTEEMLKKAPEALLAALYSEEAYALAAKGDISKAEETLEKVRKELSKKDGRYVLAKARVADVSKASNADSLYSEAEKISIQENRIYRTATILYYRALIAERNGKSEKAKDFRKRSAHAFELMGLPKPQKRSLGEE